MFMKKLFTFSLLFIFLVSGLVFADTNGIWHLAKDVRPGVFGSDEGDTTSSFTFINKVNLTQNVFYKNVELDSRYVNVLGDSMSGTLNIASTSGRGLYSYSFVDDGIAGITSAMGKSAIYGFTNNALAYSGYFEGGKFVITSGNVGIGTISPTQKLDVNGKIRMRSQTITTDSADTVATKGYVDSVTGEITCPCGTCWSSGCIEYELYAICTPRGWTSTGAGMQVCGGGGQ